MTNTYPNDSEQEMTQLDVNISALLKGLPYLAALLAVVVILLIITIYFAFRSSSHQEELFSNILESIRNESSLTIVETTVESIISSIEAGKLGDHKKEMGSLKQQLDRALINGSQSSESVRVLDGIKDDLENIGAERHSLVQEIQELKNAFENNNRLNQQATSGDNADSEKIQAMLENLQEQLLASKARQTELARQINEQKQKRSETQLMPIVIVEERLISSVEPTYSARAKSRNAEGWNEVMFDISPQGKVQSPAVTASEPAGIFDASSLRAIKQFEYSPRFESGLPVTVVGVKVKFAYSLSK